MRVLDFSSALFDTISKINLDISANCEEEETATIQMRCRDGYSTVGEGYQEVKLKQNCLENIGVLIVEFNQL